jgi:hypothetical protein
MMHQQTTSSKQRPVDKGVLRITSQPKDGKFCGIMVVMGGAA